MLGCGAALWLVTRMLPKAHCTHDVSAAEAMDVI